MRSAMSSRSAIALPSRYDLLFPLAAGGTAAVHLGRLRGIAGFWRLVAVKVAHAHLEENPLCREMMVEEARLASLIHHPNVVPVIDIDQTDGRLLLVMDYIEGASLADVLGSTEEPMPASIAVRIALDSCAGLHAAHALSDATGRSLGLVHRDVSPQNILLGTDGVARLTDFGIAKTAFGKGRSGVGTLKGKLGYMAPEYVDGQPANASSDVFGLAVVVWEMLAGHRLFRGENGHDTLRNVLYAEAPLLSDVVPSVGHDLADVLAMALAKNPKNRFASAKAFGAALELVARRADLIATPEQVTAFVMRAVGDKVNARRQRIADVFAAEKPSRSGMLSLVRPASESSTTNLVVAPGAIELRNSDDDTVSGTVSREDVQARAYQDDESSSDSPSSVTLPSATPQERAAMASPRTGEGEEPAPVTNPPVSREEPTPREVPPPRRHSDPPAGAPVIPSPEKDPSAHAEGTESPTQRPMRMRIGRDRTFQVVALAAFVFGALARVLLSMGAPDASAEPLFHDHVEHPAQTAH